VKNGAFAFVLHSHLPFVRQAGIWPFGEEWFYEGLMETYIPILDMLNELKEEGYNAKLTISITPVLLEQLADSYLLSEFQKYAQERIERAEKDIRRFAANKPFLKIATFYRDFYSTILDHFKNRYKEDVVGAFRKGQDEGCLEIITSAATHGYLPLLIRDSSISAQIKVGVDTYKRLLKRNPHGFWLPECAYRPAYELQGGKKKILKRGIDEFLKEFGIEFFISDTHAVEGGEAFVGKRLYGPYNVPKGVSVHERKSTHRTSFLPYLLESGCVVFARNRDTGLQVWSGERGYPGDGNYRDFHKKDSETGLQYWKITNVKCDLGSKEVYIRENVYPRIKENADHFVNLIEGMLSNFRNQNKKYGIIVSPYDAELFGHWWFEGVLFLKEVLKKMSDNPNVKLVTLKDYLESHPPDDVIKLPETSWGEGGYHYVWMNSQVEWLWQCIHQAEEKIEKLVEKFPRAKGMLKISLNQIARELLLLESSDWPFLITTKQAPEYASQRFLTHYERFKTICKVIENGGNDEELKKITEEIADKDNLFANLDYHVFASGLKS